MSRGIEIEVEEGGERTMQSSKEGEFSPRVNVVFGTGAEGCVVISPVGIEFEFKTRYWSVPSVTLVPVMVGDEGLRLK